MITRVGIDPGVHECGVAIEGHYRKAFLISGTLSEMLRQLNGSLHLAVRRGDLYLCVEGQQIYRSEKSKGDPNDMIRVAQVAGAVLGMLMADPLLTPTAYEVPLPRTWKGATPKAIHHERLKRDYPQWIEPVAAETTKHKQHHVWDAVGLLEWHRKQTQ